MELNEKYQTLLDMQEHPENYSEQALETMLQDPEARELIEATALLKQTMIWESTGKESADLDAEWRRFAKTHYSDSKSRRRWPMVAAIILGVVFMSGIAFAAIHFVRHVAERDAKAPIQEILTSDSYQLSIPADTVKNDTVVKTAPVVFDNVTLDCIAKEIAAYHNIGMESQSEQARQLRFYFVWKQDDSLQEVVEKLNMFEHVNMAVEDGKLIIR